MEDEPIKPTKPAAPKASAAKPAAPKPAAPKASAPKAASTTATSKPAAPKKAPATKKAPTTADNAAAAAPKAPKAAPSTDVSTEEAKQAELQSAMQGKKGGQDPKKKRTVKKLVFSLVLVVLIAAIAVGAAVVVPMLLNSSDEKEITVDIDEGMTYGETVRKFSDEVKDYNMGDKIERGLTVRNNGEGDVFVCFKIEIYEEHQEDTTYPIEMVATPTLRESFWTVGNIKEEINDTGKTATTKYYYYNNVLTKKSGGSTSTAVLFKQYAVTAESAIANQYANKSVTVKVTIKFVNANVSNLSSQTDACWNSAPETWKGIMRDATK